MGQVTKDQIERARQVDVLDYILACEPDNVKRVGNEYRLKDHESLAFNEKGFYWHSQGFGAVTALDYLVKVRELKFTEAVEKLCGYSNSPISLQGKSKLPDRSNLSLPLRNKDNRRVIEYLQSRGIDKPLILDCISRGDLYESLYRHDCVFTGRDENGKIRSATIRGTIGNFKRDTSGSDKKYGFTIPPDSNNADIAMIFESLIDALSHQTLYPEFDGWRLSLGGTSLAALEYFLEQHSEVKRCIVCTDNDGAGNLAAAKISELPGNCGFGCFTNALLLLIISS